METITMNGIEIRKVDESTYIVGDKVVKTLEEAEAMTIVMASKEKAAVIAAKVKTGISVGLQVGKILACDAGRGAKNQTKKGLGKLGETLIKFSK